MSHQLLFRKPRPAIQETIKDDFVPPGLQVHPIQSACAPPNRRLALSISTLTLVVLSCSIYLTLLSQRHPALLDHPKIISLLLEEGGDGQPAGPAGGGGGITQNQHDQRTNEAISTLLAMATRIDPPDEASDPLVAREELRDKSLELLNLEPGLLTATLSGQGNGVGSGLGNAMGNGMGAGLGHGRGSTWIHSARGDEELKVAVNFRDIQDYIPPEYPPAAEFQRISGVVILRVTIDTNGTPVKWTVIEGEPLLVAATLKVFPRWHFVAPVYRGEKVGATFEVGIRFTLK